MSEEQNADTGSQWDDLDTPVDEALLMGADPDPANDEYDPELLAAIVGEDDGADDATECAEGGKQVEDAGEPQAKAGDGGNHEPQRQTENTIPAERVSRVLDKIRSFAEQAGVEPPDFGEAVSMSLDDFNDLLTAQNRMKIKAAAASLDLDAEPAPRQSPTAPAKPAAESFDIAAQERAFLEAQYAGDFDKAIEIRTAINAELQRQAVEQVRYEAQRSAAQAAQRAEQQTATQVANKIIKDNPFLNDADSPEMADIVAWRDVLMRRGASMSEALAQAAEKVIPGYRYGGAPATNAPAPRTDARKSAAIARNVAAARAQPATPDAGIGNRAAPPSPTINTQEDWDRLPAAERERLLM